MPSSETAQRCAGPAANRAICFIDGQNLFHSSKAVFGCSQHIDPVKLSSAICRQHGWLCEEVRYYTGVPSSTRDPVARRFWDAKSHQMRQDGAFVFTRVLQYTPEQRLLQDGTLERVERRREKGIDVRMALDAVSLAYRKAFDIAVLFTQDQDLSELVSELRDLAKEQERHIQIVSAQPVSDAYTAAGIRGAQWITFDYDTYQMCLDTRDYGPALAGSVRTEDPSARRL